jgi:hypothetical protein
MANSHLHICKVYHEHICNYAMQLCLNLLVIDIREYIDCSLAQPVWLDLVEYLCCQPLLSCGATSGSEQKFYCTVYYITLNSNGERNFFLLFKGENYV